MFCKQILAPQLLRAQFRTVVSGGPHGGLADARGVFARPAGPHGVISRPSGGRRRLRRPRNTPGTSHQPPSPPARSFTRAETPGERAIAVPDPLAGGPAVLLTEGVTGAPQEKCARSECGCKCDNTDQFSSARSGTAGRRCRHRTARFMGKTSPGSPLLSVARAGRPLASGRKVSKR